MSQGLNTYSNINGTVQLVELVAGKGDGTAGSPTSLPSGTDRSGAIAAGGTAQLLAPMNGSRQSLTGQNISSGDLWINEIGGSAVVGGTGSYKIASGSTFRIATNRAVSIIGATTGQQFTATET